MPMTASAVYCQPGNYPHFESSGLAWCEPCRAWHHSEYPCSKAGQTECSECQTQHQPSADCPRQWCDDCQEYHDRDVWGEITCPGWYCEDCDASHDYGEECPNPYCSACGEHHADGDCSFCSCEAPRQDFTVPNDGQGSLASGQRAVIHLAAGVISEEGLREIGNYLRRQGDARDDDYATWWRLAYDLDEIGNRWQAKQGNYTKRLSRLAYSKHGIKLPPEVLSHVGNIARDHSSAADVEIDVTRDLNRPAADFYHEDSCWWGSYGESRCALKSNGGFGLRSFRESGSMSGRAWVMPLRREGDSLVPTFDTDSPDALVVFNGYGELSGYAAPRVMAAMHGWTYAKIEFDCSPMYVNAGGYLVGPEDIIQATKSLSLDVRQHASLYEKELAHAA